MVNGSPRERGKAATHVKAEYLDREPASEAEHVMACSRVGPVRGQAKVAPQVKSLSFGTPQGVLKDRLF